MYGDLESYQDPNDFGLKIRAKNFKEYSDLFDCLTSSISLDLLQDMKVLHGADVEAEAMNMCRQVTIRFFKDNAQSMELYNYFVTKQQESIDVVYKYVDIYSRLNEMEKDFSSSSTNKK